MAHPTDLLLTAIVRLSTLLTLYLSSNPSFFLPRPRPSPQPDSQAPPHLLRIAYVLRPSRPPVSSSDLSDSLHLPPSPAHTLRPPFAHASRDPFPRSPSSDLRPGRRAASLAQNALHFPTASGARAPCSPSQGRDRSLARGRTRARDWAGRLGAGVLAVLVVSSAA
ncbi:hypothetical protein DFH11DRAFT_1559041 [Phellopilus nigrolimitatus]|nr:hypothetical protein DFH11DRAFT_1559041 [Phellopilus nigrolimitatus]